MEVFSIKKVKVLIQNNIIMVSCICLFIIGISVIILYVNVNKEDLIFTRNNNSLVLKKEKELEEEKLKKEEENKKQKDLEDKKNAQAKKEKNAKSTKKTKPKNSDVKVKQPQVIKPTKPKSSSKSNNSSSTGSKKPSNNTNSNQISKVYTCSEAKTLQKKYLNQGKATGLSQLGNNQCLLIIY